MSAEAILMWIMLGSLLGVGACALIDWIVRKRIEREHDERTDELMRRGIKRIPPHELDDLMRKRDNVIPIRAFDKQLEIRSGGRPLHWPKLPEDAA